jgi:Virulence-associated protein E
MNDKPDFLNEEEYAAWLRKKAEDNVRPFPSAGRGRKPGPPPGGWPDWHKDLRRSAKGGVLVDLANVLIALRAEPRLIMAVGYDEMAQHSVVQREWPRAPDADPVQPPPREVSDDDVGRLQEWLQRAGLPNVGRETVGQAVEIFARERRFHPVRDWLESVGWDATERVPSAFRTYFGATGKQDYVDAISTMFFISLVARIFQPGCKCDYVVVLEGDQGILKSSACRALASAPFFSDCLPDIASKDARQHLRGKWLVEIPELAGIRKAEVENLKAFITRMSEKYRPPYGKHDVDEPRQCVFIGTTNREAYLRDETGGRRFWPVKTGAFDIAGLERDRDQLFAEAVVRFNRGEHWWPDPAFEKAHIKPEQDDRYEGDPWEEAIADRLGRLLADHRRRPREQRLKGLQTYVLDIARDALGFDAHARVGPKERDRIVAVLLKQGWRREKHDARGTPYLPPAGYDVGKFCSNCGAVEGAGCGCKALFC